MRSGFRRYAGWLGIAVVAFVGAALFFPQIGRWTDIVGTEVAGLQVQGADVADFSARQEPGEKAADLRRAEANGDVSPNRLVIVYDVERPVNDAARQRARQQAGGRLLRASVALKQDVLRLDNDDAAQAAQRVRNLPGVLDAYPDPIARAILTVNDPLLGQEWGLGKIDAPTAWDTSTASGVSVAVLDCGVHRNHPDLAGKVVLEHNFTASPDADDLCNHGTHVAGTLGAVTNNAVGIAAAAPAATLMNGKVLSDEGSGFFSDIDLAMQWAADKGARVINMSLGADISCPTGTQVAADYAWNAGAVPVAAAGNSGRPRAGAPANCQNVISVAATDANDAKARWSNYGENVDVAAPGVSILSTVNPAVNSGAEYASFSGTSMASPHTAAVVALLWSTSYGSSPAAVRDRLFASTEQIGETGRYWAYGRIHAARAVQGGSVTPTPTETATATATATETPDPNATATSTPMPTDTPTPTATATSTATATNTPVPTDTPLVPPPDTPTDLRAEARPQFIRLSWTASSTSGVTYHVYRGASAGGAKERIATVSDSTRYDDRAVTSGQAYYYHVTASGPSGESEPSNEAVATAR